MRSLCVLLTLFPSALPVRAADWPQWRGAQRNGVSAEKGWTWQWGEAGPSGCGRRRSGRGTRPSWSSAIGRSRPTVIYQNAHIRTHVNTCVLLNGFLYGNDQRTLKCIEFKTGEGRWGQESIGKGGLIAADGKLIVLSEKPSPTPTLNSPAPKFSTERATRRRRWRAAGFSVAAKMERWCVWT